MHLHMHSPAMFWPECDKPSCAGRSPKHDSFPVPIGAVRHMSGSTGRHAQALAEPFCRPDRGSERKRRGLALGPPGAHAPGYELPPLRGWEEYP